jgi:hypothetical protein
MSESKNDSTESKVVEVLDIDELLGTSSSVTIAADESSKKSVLDNIGVDSSFLDNLPDNTAGRTDDVGVINNKTPEEIEAQKAKAVLDNTLIQPGADEELEDEKNINQGGRKPALIEAMNKLVANKTIDLFEDQPDIYEYTIDDIVELFEANIKNKVNYAAQDAAQKAPMEIFGKLDPKIQDVVAYALNGGTDVTSVLKTVARSQEITELSLDNEEDQERIVREWLRASNVMNDDEIEDEILSIVDRGDLEKKASQFKPKLDEKQSTIMQKKIDDQELAKKRAQEASKVYAETIYNSLNTPDLNGIPLDNKVQTMLYYGLTDNTKYQDRNGNSTNALGHLIEEYQFGENANPKILLEALWLMSDPGGYRNSLLALGQQVAHGKTLRALKTAEGEKLTASSKLGDKRDVPTKRSNVQRNTGSGRNMFSR